jgi:Polyketide cyclase / dehydrase and lipid transport
MPHHGLSAYPLPMRRVSRTASPSHDVGRSSDTHSMMNPFQSPAFTGDPLVALHRMTRSFSYRIEQPSTATPVAVYDTLIDVERWPDWVPSLVAASWERRGAPDTGEGGIRRTRSRMLGAPLTLREEILGGTRPHHHSYKLLSHALGLNNYRAEVHVEEQPNGCLITWTGTFSPLIPGLGKPLQIFTRSHIKRLAAALAREAQRVGR